MRVLLFCGLVALVGATASYEDNLYDGNVFKKSSVIVPAAALDAAYLTNNGKSYFTPAQSLVAPVLSPTLTIAKPIYSQPVAVTKFAEPAIHGPQPYSFGYKVKEDQGTQYREETGDAWGAKKGSYGYTDAWGIYRQVDYVADEYGFRASIRTNEPGTANQDPASVSMDAAPAPYQTLPLKVLASPAKVIHNYDYGNVYVGRVK